MSILTSCNRGEQNTPSTLPLPEQKIMNVSYGKDSLQRMDIYLPAGRSADSTKALVLIHGGGWNGGSKAEFAPYMDSFRKLMPGYAIFNLDYRLVGNGHLFPTQEMDVKAAIDQIVAKSKEYAFDTDQIALLGVSAGAHLALLQAYKYNHPRIKAVVDFFGPTDLLTMYKRPWHPLVPYALQMVTGTTPAAGPDVYTKSSPVHFIDNNTPPTLIFHGGKDHIVDISQSRLLANKLQKEGIVHELVVYPEARHGWAGAQMEASLQKARTFLQQHLR